MLHSTLHHIHVHIHTQILARIPKYCIAHKIKMSFNAHTHTHTAYFETECSSILVFHTQLYGVLRVRHINFPLRLQIIHQEQEMEKKQAKKNLKQQRTVQFPLGSFGSVFRSRKHVNRHDLRCTLRFHLHFHFQNLAYCNFLFVFCLCNAVIWCFLS